LRLRAPSYDVAGLSAWHERIAAQPWQRAFVYLKHEVFGPLYAQGLVALSKGETPVLPSAPIPPPLARGAGKKKKSAAPTDAPAERETPRGRASEKNTKNAKDTKSTKSTKKK
jgi:hypothetical protein